MSNWDYASKYPSPIWRGQMTSPRELTITDVAGENFLAANPIAALDVANDYTFAINADEDSIITISDNNQEVVIRFNAEAKRISIDRGSAWFAEIEDAPQLSPQISVDRFTVRILLDHGSLELFVPEVALAMTSLHTLPASSVVLQKTAKRLS